MRIFQYFSLKRIKAKGYELVKLGNDRQNRAITLWGYLTVLILYPPSFAHALPQLYQDNLPTIEAQAFNVEVISRSNSNQTYLLDDPSHIQPKVGRILMLKKNDHPAMIVRVLKLYPNESLIAAKKIKKYGSIDTFENKEVLIAVEKIMDSIPPAVTLADEEDLQELEEDNDLEHSNSSLPGTPPNTPPIPQLATKSALTPSPVGSGKINSRANMPSDTDTTDSDEENVDTVQDSSSLVIQEIRTLDQLQHWLTLGFGIFKSYNPSRQTTYLTSGNVRYGITILKRFLINRPNVQDSVVAESSFYFFKAINYAVVGDAYSVIGVSPTLRYNVQFGQKFGVFAFTGLLKNYITSTNNPQASAAQLLAKSSLAAGLGLYLQLGPNWYTRLDLGIEAFSANLVLRF